MNTFTPPTGTITFLFSDIEGSTRLWEAHPDAMQIALAQHDGILRAAISAAGGVVFKTVGDAFCAAFATAPDALDAALAAQVALTREAWETPNRLSVRMALHTGSAQRRDGDYFGPPLNRVARLLSAGQGGQTLVSAAAYELIRDRLPDGAGLLDLGLHHLRDLERPEHIYQVTHPALPAAFAPLRTLDNPDLPNNLPRQLTSFVGREKQIADISALLAHTHLLTLTGTGGAGKTRLSLQVAADALDAYPDGVWQVELAALSDPALVGQTVAQVLKVKEQAGQPLTQTLTDALRNKRLLLLLDNCEHVLTACAQLTASLLRACPGVRMVATSREPMGIAGEQTYRVPSLSLPDPRSSAATPASVGQFEAVRLFVERALLVKPDWAVTNANAPALAQLCCRLDGIPLALELAAARVRSLSVEQINDKLDTRFRLLTGGDRSALPRQQTLRALVDWSYDLLTDAEKTLFARLSVFAGGWTLAAAEAICGWGDIEEWGILDLLTSLADKSLIIAEENIDATRYRMLETLHQYGGERLTAAGEGDTLFRRHLAFYTALVEEAEPGFWGPEQAIVFSQIETEHDNIRAALMGAATLPPADPDTFYALRLAGSLWWFWYVRGYLAEGREQIARALAHTPETDTPETREPARLRAKALRGAGLLAANQDDYPAAQSLNEQALLRFRALGDTKGTTATLNGLGSIAFKRGDNDTAQALFTESLVLYREMEDNANIANSLNNLGNIALRRGDAAGAGALYQESLATYRQVGNQNHVGNSLNNLANVAWEAGDMAAARRLYEEALAIYRALGNKNGIANELMCLGFVLSRQGDTSGAGLFLAESLALNRDLGNKGGVAYALEGFAFLSLQKQEMGRAVLLWGAASALRETAGAPLASHEQVESEQWRAQARAMLGEAEYSIAWSEGRALTMEQAIEYALPFR